MIIKKIVTGALSKIRKSTCPKSLKLNDSSTKSIK